MSRLGRFFRIDWHLVRWTYASPEQTPVPLFPSVNMVESRWYPW